MHDSAETARPEGSGLYGRRKGKKLRALQADRVESVLPALSIDTTGVEAIEPVRLFGEAPRDIVMEIGFGGGEHLVAEALAHPDIGFIGCEPFVNGVAKLLAAIQAEDLRNIRVHQGNALDVLRRLPSASLARVDLLYPDPWPKRRQRKRRFVSDETLVDLARALRSGASFRFASDIDDYCGWVLARIGRTSLFRWDAAGAADWLQPWPGYRRTRYEEKAIRENRPLSFLTFVRTDAAAF